MFQEFDLFVNESEHFDEIIVELHQDRIKLQTKRNLLEDEYSRLLADNEIPQKEFTSRKKEMSRIDEQIALIDERIAAIRLRAKDELRQKLELVKEGRDREVRNVTEEIENVAFEVKKSKASFLESILNLRNKVQKLKSIHSCLIESAHSIDCHDYDRYFLSIPSLHTTSVYGSEDQLLAPTTQEINLAYNAGIVQPWVELFIATDGKELASNNTEARKRLAELKKRGVSNE